MIYSAERLNLIENKIQEASDKLGAITDNTYLINLYNLLNKISYKRLAKIKVLTQNKAPYEVLSNKGYYVSMVTGKDSDSEITTENGLDITSITDEQIIG